LAFTPPADAFGLPLNEETDCAILNRAEHNNETPTNAKSVGAVRLLVKIMGQMSPAKSS
jgi:hypothetical protein